MNENLNNYTPEIIVVAFFDKIGVKLPLWQIHYIGY